MGRNPDSLRRNPAPVARIGHGPMTGDVSAGIMGRKRRPTTGRGGWIPGPGRRRQRVLRGGGSLALISQGDEQQLSEQQDEGQAIDSAHVRFLSVLLYRTTIRVA